MRTTIFGDMVIEDVKDDMGEVEVLQLAEDEVYAIIRLDDEESGMYFFEVMQNEDGEQLVSSEPIFATIQDAKDYLKGFVTDIQVD